MHSIQAEMAARVPNSLEEAVKAAWQLAQASAYSYSLSAGVLLQNFQNMTRA